MSIAEFIEAQHHNLQQVSKFPHFALLVQRTDEIYNHTIAILPSDVPARYIRFLLILHKSFLSAATLIGQCQPDDAAAVTRRAIEVARICLASKHDESNYEKWLSYEKRYQRWQSREKNEKPPPLPPVKLILPSNHPILDDLMRQSGSYSDAFVHFTPEYFTSLNWKDNREAEPPRIVLSYFISDTRVLERELLSLTGIHYKFLLIINESVNGDLLKDSQWKSLMASLYNAGTKLGYLFGNKTKEGKP